MTNAKTAQAFIDGNRHEGHNSTGSIYFVDQIIYSYGQHYPLGIKRDNTLIVNCTSWSNSTAKHRNHLLSAWDYAENIDAPNEAMKKLANDDLAGFKAEALKYHAGNIAEAKEKLERVRTEHMRDFWNDEITRGERQIELLTNLN